MKDVLKAMEERSSTRAYTKESITLEELECLVRAGLQGPTAANRQEIHISVAEGGSPVLAEIEEAKNAGAGTQAPPHNFYYEAPLVLVLSGDKDFYWSAVDAGIAVQNIALAAEGLGLGSVIIGCIRDAMQGEKREYFADALNFPEGYEYEVAIAVGHKAAEKIPHEYSGEKNVSCLVPLRYEVRYTMKPGRRAEFLRKVEEYGIAEASRKDPGNRRYEYVLPEEPDILLLTELWDTKEQQRAHMGTEHVTRLLELKEQCVEKTEIDVFVGK